MRAIILESGGLTNECTVPPRSPEDISPDNLSDRTFPACSTRKAQQVLAPVQTNRPYASRAIEWKREVFPIAGARVESDPPSGQGVEELGNDRPGLKRQGYAMRCTCCQSVEGQTL